jgi:RNA polymerase sigma factor (sigma-70 family)
VSLSPTESSHEAVAPSPPCIDGPKDRLRWFHEEVHPHRIQLRSYLRKVFPSVHDVDDVLQESFLRVWKASAIKEIRYAKAFLFVVARRLAIDIVRRDRCSPFIPVTNVGQLFVSVTDKTPDAAWSENRKHELQLLVEAIDSLPARCREAFVLCQIEGISQKEVAARLGIAESTVAVQSSRGLQRCESFIRNRLKRA